MGMFSARCKGCDRGLIMGEWVRIGGGVGEYDGYGWGNADSFRLSPCWHEICYQRASEEDKLDFYPSLPDRNQGFGMPALEYLRGYDPSKPYSITVNVDAGVSGAQNKFDDGYLTLNGFMSLKEFDRKEHDLNKKWMEIFKEFPNGISDHVRKKQEDLEKRVRSSNPLKLAIRFKSHEAALNALEPYMSEIIKHDYWSIYLIGRQGNLVGVVEEFGNDEFTVDYKIKENNAVLA